jgi:hypothetical protein
MVLWCRFHDCRRYVSNSHLQSPKPNIISNDLRSKMDRLASTTGPFPYKCYEQLLIQVQADMGGKPLTESEKQYILCRYYGLDHEPTEAQYRSLHARNIVLEPSRGFKFFSIVSGKPHNLAQPLWQAYVDAGKKRHQRFGDDSPESSTSDGPGMRSFRGVEEKKTEYIGFPTMDINGNYTSPPPWYPLPVGSPDPSPQQPPLPGQNYSYGPPPNTGQSATAGGYQDYNQAPDQYMPQPTSQFGGAGPPPHQPFTTAQPNSGGPPHQVMGPNAGQQANNQQIPHPYGTSAGGYQAFTTGQPGSGGPPHQGRGPNAGQVANNQPIAHPPGPAAGGYPDYNQAPDQHLRQTTPHSGGQPPFTTGQPGSGGPPHQGTGPAPPFTTGQPGSGGPPHQGYHSYNIGGPPHQGNTANSGGAPVPSQHLFTTVQPSSGGAPSQDTGAEPHPSSNETPVAGYQGYHQADQGTSNVGQPANNQQFPHLNGTVQGFYSGGPNGGYQHYNQSPKHLLFPQQPANPEFLTPQRLDSAQSSSKRTKVDSEASLWLPNPRVQGRYIPTWAADQKSTILINGIKLACETKTQVEHALKCLANAVQLYEQHPHLFHKELSEVHIDFLIQAIVALVLILMKIESNDYTRISPSQRFDKTKVTRKVSDYITCQQIMKLIPVKYETPDKLVSFNKNSHRWYNEEREKVMKASCYYYLNTSDQLVPDDADVKIHYFRDHLILLWHLECWFDSDNGAWTDLPGLC